MLTCSARLSIIEEPEQINLDKEGFMWYLAIL